MFVITIMSSSSAYGHKLITHDDKHRNLENALEISDHKISWAIYENLGPYEEKFYSFEAKSGDSFYASIVIPKIAGLEEYSPTLVLINSNYIEQDDNLLESQAVMEKVDYDEGFPGIEFYEPFGQVTYWERQEIKTTLTTEGKYYLIVLDEKNQVGKYSLAVGTIEDFSGEDLFTTLPTAWLETKLFVEDYASVAIFVLVLIGIVALPIIVIRRKINRSKTNISSSGNVLVKKRKMK